MSATTRATCRSCGRHRRDAGEISWQGYCNPCGHAIRNANNDQLHEGHGPFYVHWTYRSFIAARARVEAVRQQYEGVQGSGGYADGR